MLAEPKNVAIAPSREDWKALQQRDAVTRAMPDETNRREIQVVCEDDITVLTRPINNLFVGRPGIAHGSPVDGFDGTFAKDICPEWR